MLRVAWPLLAATVAFSRCDPPATPPPATVAYELTETDMRRNARCHLRNLPLTLPPHDTGVEPPALFLARGPGGWRVFQGTHSQLLAGDGVESVPVALTAAPVWTGRTWLGPTARGLSAWAPNAPRARVVPLRGPVCQPTLGAPRNGSGALAAWHQTAGNDCALRRADATVVLQALDADGAPVGAPQPLLGPGEANSPFLSFGLRCDQGFCVASETARDPIAGQERARYTLVTPGGETTGHGHGDVIACPDTGCVRLVSARDGGGGAAPSGLRVELLGRNNVGFVLPVGASDTVTQVATWRSLVLTALFNDAAYADSVGPHTEFAIVDVASRHLLSVEGGTSPEPYTVWAAPENLHQLEMASDDEGFVMVTQIPGATDPNTRAPGPPVYGVTEVRCSP